jgi:DNA mismatch repair ATPase MutS
MMPQESLLKPSTSPLSLYDLGERSEALNMVIELWIRLTEIYWEKVKEGLRVIAKYLAEISSYSDQELGTMFNKLSEEFSLLASSPPVRAPDAERLLRETMDLSYKAIERIKLDLEYIGDLARDLAPEASRVIKFGVLQEIKDLEELSKKVQEFDGSILSAQEILKSLTSLLSIHRSNMRQDEEKIVLLVAYPIAKSIIEEKLSIASRISITELPFSLHASSFYARMYSETSKRTEYIEYLGVIEVKGKGGGDHSG